MGFVGDANHVRGVEPGQAPGAPSRLRTMPRSMKFSWNHDHGTKRKTGI